MSDELPALSPDQIARLGRGEIIIEPKPEPGSDLPRVTIMAVIEAPSARVWRLIDDVPNYHKNLAGVKRARELSRDGEKVRVEATIGVPFPLKDITATSDSLHQDLGEGRYRRSWKMVHGDYKANSGSWDIVPFEGNEDRTLIIYQVFAVPKMRIPKKIQELAQKKAGPKMVEQLRKLCR
jgi:ribosome-associated toxin RatA of RatAB toxin-antitoxin module